MGSSVISANKFKRVSGGNRTTIDGHTLNYRKGQDWYVDASRSGTGSGKSWDDAFLTMTEAFAKIGSGDSIYFVGKVNEQLTTPVQVFDVRVIGMGNRPRHADSTPSGGNTHAAQWAAASLTAATANVRVLQQGWSFENILFSMVDTNAAAIEFVRNAASGDSERDASHAVVSGCRFAGAGVGIRINASGFSENLNGIVVEDCQFNDNTTSISGGGLFRAVIRDNIFKDNTNAVVLTMDNSYVYGNLFGTFTTKSLNLTAGTGAGLNVVTKNHFTGDYSTSSGHYLSATNDDWVGNTAADIAETTEVGAETGITFRVPQA